MWNTDDGSLIAASLGLSGKLEFVAISPHDKMIAAGGRRTPIQLWHSTPVMGWRHHSDFSVGTSSHFWAATFLDRRRLITTGDDGTIHDWDIYDLPSHRRIPVEIFHDFDIALTRDGRHVVSGAYGVSVYGLFDGVRVQELAPNTEKFSWIALTAEGTTLIAGSPPGPQVSWQLSKTSGWKRRDEQDSRAEALKIPGTTHRPGTSVVHRPFVSLSGNVVALMSQDGQLQIWRDGLLRSESAWKRTRFRAGALSMDGRRFAMCDDNGSMQIIQTDENRPETEFFVTPSPSKLELSPNGNTLVTQVQEGPAGDQIRIKLWNVATGRQLLELETGCSRVGQPKFSADGRTLVAIGENIVGNSEILVWTTSSSEPRE